MAKFTSPSKVLPVLGWWTDAHREDYEHFTLNHLSLI